MVYRERGWVAMRSGASVYYLLTDHLGGTNVTITTAGVEYGELRYKAWGETCYTSGTTPTTMRYTGQRQESYINLYWYNSRWYDPALGRFISADTIVPNPGDPVAWDRYAYVRNRPVNLIDPSGHLSCSAKYVADGDCEDRTIRQQIEDFGVNLTGTFTSNELFEVLHALQAVGSALINFIGGTAETAFQAAFGGFGPLEIAGYNSLGSLSGQWADGKVKLDSGEITARLVVHELAHAFASRVYDTLTYRLGGDVERSPVNILSNTRIYAAGKLITGLSLDGGRFDRYGKNDTEDYAAPDNGFLGDYQNDPDQWQVHPLGMEPDGNTAGEQYADMFLNWTYSTFAGNSAGFALNSWMTSNMSEWVSIAATR